MKKKCGLLLVVLLVIAFSTLSVAAVSVGMDSIDWVVFPSTNSLNSVFDSTISPHFIYSAVSPQTPDTKVIFSLDSTYYVSSIRVRLTTDVNSQYNDSCNLYVSTDGQNYVSKGTITQAANSSSYYTVNVNSNVRYFKLTNFTGGTYARGCVSMFYIENATAVTLPSAPTGFTATAGNGKLDLSWTAVSGATGYNVKRAITSGGTYTTIANNVITTSYSDTTVTAGTTYYYVVSAVNANGESTNSNEMSGAPIAPAPSAPTNLTATEGNAKVDLSWTAVTGATGYNVKRAATPGGPYTTVVPSVVGAAYADTTVTNGTTYYYVVSAINANGESVNSSEVTATPKAPAVTLDITSIDTAKVGYEIIADVVIHNANNICAEDIRISYDTNLLEYIGAVNADGMKIYSETDLTNGVRRYITASLGKANAANGDKILLKLKFKAKAVGQAKIDITSGRIADNATLEADVAPENCGEKIITIETTKDVNRTGEFTLLDLGIDAWYFGDAASATDTTKYDADVVVNNTIDDSDLSDIVSEMLKNTNYVANK